VAFQGGFTPRAPDNLEFIGISSTCFGRIERRFVARARQYGPRRGVRGVRSRANIEAGDVAGAIGN
jgi:hypothetical protein